MEVNTIGTSFSSLFFTLASFSIIKGFQPHSHEYLKIQIWKVSYYQQSPGQPYS